MGPEGIPPPDAYLDATFGDGGYLARAHPGYRPRAGQRAFAEAVDRAIRTGGVLLTEAATGVGKTLSYLVPASYAAATQNKRTVVVTANLGLQDQIIDKDLPALARAVPWPVNYAVFKGRGNYACLSRIHDLEQDALRYRKPRGHGIDRDLLAWADTLYAQAARAENQEDEWPVGDRKELPREPSDEDWRKLSVGAEECLKDRCPFKKRCLANRAQARGRAGSIVVTNYKVLFIHLGLASIIGDVILGPYDTIVADECFPAGTLIDRRPIESIREGDMVNSFDERTGRMVQRPVRHVFVNRAPQQMVRITFFSGRSVIATMGHPFFTRHGWVRAGRLAPSDEVYHAHALHGVPSASPTIKNAACQRTGGPRLLQARLCERTSPTGTNEDHHHALRTMRKAGLGNGPGDEPLQDKRASLLFTNLYPYVGSQPPIKFANHQSFMPPMWEDQDRPYHGSGQRLLFGRTQNRISPSETVRGHAPSNDSRSTNTTLGTHANSQSNGRSRNSPTSDCDSSRARACTHRSWRQWTPAPDSPTHAAGTTARTREFLASRVSCSNSPIIWSPADNRDRYRSPGKKDCCRDRWGFASEAHGQGPRCEKDVLSSFDRVDRVEILESRSDATFGGLCPDGLVYNLEVDETHTYFANGLAVHNCHKMADLARDHFGFDPLSEASFRRAVARVPDHALAETLRRQVGGFFQRLDLLYHQRYGARLRSSSFVPEDLAAATDLLLTLGVAKDRLLAAARAKEDEAAMLAEPLDDVAGNIPDGFLKRPDDDEVRQAVREATDLTKAAQGLLSCADRVRSAIDPDFDEEHVIALERTEKGAIRVLSKLVHPDRVLRPALFGSRLRTVDGVSGMHPHAAFIGTSATLTTKAGDFEYIVKEIGAPLTETTTLTVGTPFDWWNQALLVLAEGMPTDPNTPAFTEAVGHALERIVVLAGGRTLGLFTSYAGMKAARERLAPVCARHGFRLLVQGDSSRARLVQTFRDEVTSVLLGVESFWAGVDVPGESLSVVVIDKLPFPPKNDPVLDRLEELEGKEAFWKYRLPRAVLALRQGAGRLIRSERCRGVIVCLDPRMITKGYGATFRESLPKTQVSRRLDAVAEFLRPQPPQPWDAP